MKVKDSLIIAAHCSANLTAYDGYCVIADETLPGDLTSSPGVKLPTTMAADVVGVITTPADGATDRLSMAVRGFGGSLRIKLGGAVNAFDRLTLMANGRCEANGEGTLVGMALESGAVDELVEGTLANPSSIGSISNS